MYKFQLPISYLKPKCVLTRKFETEKRYLYPQKYLSVPAPDTCQMYWCTNNNNPKPFPTRVHKHVCCWHQTTAFISWPKCPFCFHKFLNLVFGLWSNYFSVSKMYISDLYSKMCNTTLEKLSCNNANWTKNNNIYCKRNKA